MQANRYQKWNWQHKATEDEGNARMAPRTPREKGRRRVIHSTCRETCVLGTKCTRSLSTDSLAWLKN